MAKLIISDKDFEEIILNALCNGALCYLRDANVVIDLDKSNYNEHRIKGECYEVNLIEVLKKGGKIVFEDSEGDEDGEFSFAEGKERLENHSDEWSNQIMNCLKGEDDAEDGYIVLQLCIYQDVPFG